MTAHLTTLKDGWAKADTSAMSAVPAAAWFPDPEDPTMLRWWDGGSWTEHRHPASPAEPAVQAQPQPQVVLMPVPMPAAAAAPHASPMSAEQLQLQREQLELQRQMMANSEARADRMEQRMDEREGGLLQRLDDARSLMSFARMFGIGR